MANLLTAKILSDDELELMKEKVQKLLSTKGVEINHSEVREKLAKAGAQISDDDDLVYFSKSLIEEALDSIPSEFTLAAPKPENDLKFPHPEGLFYTRTCTGGMNYYNAEQEYYEMTLDDVEEYTRLGNSLEHINYQSVLSPAGDESIPGETIDIHTLSTVLQNNTKHTWVQPYEAENVKYLIDLAAAAAGGKEELRERPIISFIACAATPLDFKYMDMEIVLQACNHGIPIQACSLPTAGANAPVTLPGTALMASAEVMALIVISQLLAPGTPVIATPLLFAMDMMTTYTLQSPIEVTMGRMAAMQFFADGYGIPVHTYGTGTDSFTPDGQSMSERTSITQMVALSGASVLGGAGQIEVAKTISPIQLIIDNDIFGLVKRLKRGLVIDDETLAWEEIMGLSGREDFLSMDHTYRHYKDIVRPATFNRDSRPSWESNGSQSLVDKATEIYHSLKEDYETPSLSKEVVDKLDKVVKKADEALVK